MKYVWKYMLHISAKNTYIYIIISGVVVPGTISDAYVVPEAREHFLQHLMTSIGASIMPIGLPSLMDKPTMLWPSCSWNS